MLSESTDGYPPNLLRPRAEGSLELWTYGAAMLVALAVGAWLTFPAWGASPPAGDDVAAHVVRAEFAFEHIFGRGDIDGWFPRFMVGHQEFLFYGQGYSWFVGLIRLVTFGTLSTVGAVKVAGIAAIVGMAPATMFLARSLGLRAPAAAAAGLLALVVNSPFGVGLRATYVIGLLPNQFAAVLFCVALGSAARVARGGNRHWVAVSALAFGLLAVTHVITAGIAIVFFGLVLIAQIIGRDTSPGWWQRLGLAGGLTLGLTAFWTVPFLVHRDLRGPVTAWSTPSFLERVSQILSGEVLFPMALSVAAGVSLLITMWFAPRPQAVVAVIPVVYLSLVHAVLAAAPGNPIAIQLPNRGLGYAGIVALLPIGITLDAAFRWLQRHARLLERSSVFVGVGVVAVAGAGTMALVAPARGVVAERGKPQPAFAAVASELAARVPDGSRFATERDFPAEIDRAGFSHPDLWLAQMSGRNTLNNFNPESAASPAGFVTEDIRRPPPTELAASLARYGVSHLVTVRPETARDLRAAAPFRLAWQRGDFAILSVVTPGRVGPLYASDLDGSLRVAEPEYIAATVRVPTATRLSAALSWSPKWQVTVDGVDMPTRPGSDRIVTFELPAGSSDVELRFRRDRWDLIGGAVSVATAALVAYLSLSVSMSSLMSRRRSRTA